MARIELSGKPIVITGASSGIGAATALACARAGMPVVLGARREDRLGEVAKQVEQAGGQVVTRRVDVDDAEDCRALVDAAAEAFGSVYAVFANAGYGFESGVEATDDEAYRAIFQTNFYGTLHTIRPALERMRKAGQGHVLICSSCLSKIGLPYYSAYCMTKAAQDHLGKALRHELRPAGIAVSTVHPIGTKTEFFDKSRERTGRETLADRAGGRFMQPPEKVARAVVRCLRRPRAEVWTSAPTRLAFAATVAMPGVTDRVLRMVLTKRLRAHAEGEQAS